MTQSAAVVLLFIGFMVVTLSFCIEKHSYGSSALSDRIKNIDLFSLESIRSTLIRQEETIIFALIERAQYRQNRAIYSRGDYSFCDTEGKPLSFLEWMLVETEKLHSKVRRYTSPEEHPFFPDALPEPVLPKLEYPEILVSGKNKVNLNSEIMEWYLRQIISDLCVSGDDEQHGSSVLCDISVLQALSRRIHYGKFVAESKFLKDPETYTTLVKAGKIAEVVQLLTNVEVEKRVLRRAFVKASTFGRDITGETPGYKVPPMLIANIYRDCIIPLTKDVEVRYLHQRLGLSPPHQREYLSFCRGPLDAFEDPDALNDLTMTAKNQSINKNR